MLPGAFDERFQVLTQVPPLMAALPHAALTLGHVVEGISRSGLTLNPKC